MKASLLLVLNVAVSTYGLTVTVIQDHPPVLEFSLDANDWADGVVLEGPGLDGAWVTSSTTVYASLPDEVTGGGSGIDITGAWISDDRVPGDINLDNYVNVGDLQQLVNKWSLTSASPGWEPLCDLNDDGLVNVADLMILAAHWAQARQILWEQWLESTE